MKCAVNLWVTAKQVWCGHTQGSGKITQHGVFTQVKIVLALNNPTIVVITDRKRFRWPIVLIPLQHPANYYAKKPKQVEDRQQLKELLKVASGGVIFYYHSKVSAWRRQCLYETLSDRRNIVVICRRGHTGRNMGFKAKTVEDKKRSWWSYRPKNCIWFLLNICVMLYLMPLT